MRMGTIYKITNKINNRFYIGKTIGTIEKRWQEHLYDMEHNRDNSILHNAMRKYGVDNFSIEVIESNIPEQQLDSKEKEYIEHLKSHKKYGNYNITDGGNGGVVSSKITKEQAAEIQWLLVNNYDLSAIEIAKMYGLTSVNGINRGKTWYDENLKYPLRDYKKWKNYQSVDLNSYQSIVKDLQDDILSINEILKKYNIGWTALMSINEGKYCYNKNNDYYKDYVPKVLPINKNFKKEYIDYDNNISFILCLFDFLFTDKSILKISKEHNFNNSTLYYILNNKRKKNIMKDYKFPLRENLDFNQQVFKEKYKTKKGRWQYELSTNFKD